MRAVSWIALSLLLASCKTARTPAAPEAQLEAQNEGPATQRVRERQEDMQDELDFTLGEPLSPRARPRGSDDRFTKSYGRPGR